MDERTLRIFWALCPGLEPSTFRKMFRHFGSALALHEATDESWRAAVARLHPETLASMHSWREGTARRVASLEDHLLTRQIHCVVQGDSAYPASLLSLYDPPITLFMRGSQTILDQMPCVAVVGTRRASSYGIEVTKWIASSLARKGAVICSGMALGIDATAHHAALDEAGHTIAVLGCGVGVCYPPSHRQLFAEIANRGLLVSEYAPTSLAAKHRFPERNRLIAALSRLTVVVQAGERSGALGTAMSALELGREVYVVPGPITTKSFRGSHQLLFDGAIPLVDPDGLANELSYHAASMEDVVQVDFPAHLRSLGELLQEEGHLRAGELSQLSGLPPSHIYAALLEMELGGYIRRLPDGRYETVSR